METEREGVKEVGRRRDHMREGGLHEEMRKGGRRAWRSGGAAVECCSSENYYACNRHLPLANITAQQLPGA